MDLGKASTKCKWYLARSGQYQCVFEISSKYSIRFKRRGSYTFLFRIGTSVKASIDEKLYLAILGLDLLNINVYARSYPNITYGSWVMGNFLFFTKTKSRLIENGVWQFPGIDLVNINVHTKFHQNIQRG